MIGLALLALTSACKVSIGGPPAGASGAPPPVTTAPPAEAATPPSSEPAATPELTAARTKLVALINASVVQRCDAGEAPTAADQAACTDARANLTVAGSPKELHR